MDRISSALVNILVVPANSCRILLRLQLRDLMLTAEAMNGRSSLALEAVDVESL